MKIFLDTADLGEIERWLGEGIVDGVTTNPSIARRDGVRDIESFTRRLAARISPRPLSVEVRSADRAGMLAEGRALARLATNVAVKVPVITETGESCLGVVHRLAAEGVAVNVTAVLSFNQALLAAKAGARFVSVFAGRVADEGHDPAALLRSIRSWLDAWRGSGIRAELLAGSIRGVFDVQAAAASGAEIITIPPPLIAKMLDHRYTRETVRQFNADACAVAPTPAAARAASAAHRGNREPGAPVR
jgi:transaldolase